MHSGACSARSSRSAPSAMHPGLPGAMSRRDRGCNRRDVHLDRDRTRGQKRGRQGVRMNYSNRRVGGAEAILSRCRSGRSDHPVECGHERASADRESETRDDIDSSNGGRKSCVAKSCEGATYSRCGTYPKSGRSIPHTIEKAKEIACTSPVIMVYTIIKQVPPRCWCIRGRGSNSYKEPDQWPV